MAYPNQNAMTLCFDLKAGVRFTLTRVGVFCVARTECYNDHTGGIHACVTKES
jgi:hypothetical protein